MKRRINKINNKILVSGGGENTLNKNEILVENNNGNIQLKERDGNGEIKSITGSNDDLYYYFISNNIDTYNEELLGITGVIFSGTSPIDRTLVLGSNISGIAYFENSLSEFSDNITPNNNISIAAFRLPKQFIHVYTDDSVNHSVLIKLDATEALFFTLGESDTYANSKEEAEQKFKETIHSRIEELKASEFAKFFFGTGTLETEGMTINLPLFRECTKEEYYSLAQ